MQCLILPSNLVYHKLMAGTGKKRNCQTLINQKRKKKSIFQTFSQCERCRQWLRDCLKLSRAIPNSEVQQGRFEIFNLQFNVSQSNQYLNSATYYMGCLILPTDPSILQTNGQYPKRNEERKCQTPLARRKQPILLTLCKMNTAYSGHESNVKSGELFWTPKFSKAYLKFSICSFMFDNLIYWPIYSRISV